MPKNARSNKRPAQKGRVMKLSGKEANETEVLKSAGVIKTIDQDICAGDSFLKDKVLNAFHLAKSAGRELNITFIGQSISTSLSE